MNEAKYLVKKITEGIQEKKGKNIVIADLSSIDDTICNYFVICQGNSPSQVTAIVDSVKDYVRIATDNKPTAIDGLQNAQCAPFAGTTFSASCRIPVSASRASMVLLFIWSLPRTR